MSQANELKQRILELVAEYHDVAFPQRPFVPQESQVPVSGRVFDALDMQSLIESSLDFWLTTGRFAARFERAFARFSVCAERRWSIRALRRICWP